jgi:tetratricopeptide (TPR) repeat protein
MTKQILHAVGIIALMLALTACSSPEEKAAGYIISGDDLFQEGDLNKAEVQYKNALQVNQNLPDAWFGLAKIHERRAEWKRAYSVLNQLRELSPQHVDGRLMLAQLLLTANELYQAMLDATEILEMAPDDVRSHTLMAAVQFQLGNLEGAQKAVSKALELDANHADALLVQAQIMTSQERYDDALALLDKAIETTRDNVSYYLMKLQVNRELGDRGAIEQVYLALVDQFPAESKYKQALARHYLEGNDLDSAERVLQQIVESEPENIDYRVSLVVFKRQHRSLDEAITLVESYIKSEEEEYRFRFLLGDLYESDKQNDNAVAIYENIIADDGTQSNGLDARNKIALIEMRAGNRSSAHTLINEVLEEDKNNENALLLQAGFQISDGEFDDAILSARTLLRDNPDSIQGLALLGQAYEASGSRELAIESYSNAFQLSPGTPTIANRLAQFYLLERNAARADEILQQSFNSGNRSAEALKLLTQAKLALGDWDRAEQLARQLQKVEGQEADSLQLLGVVYLGKQQMEASIEAFRRAHELAPGAEQPVISLVRTYVSSGRSEEARRFLETILKVDDDNVNALMLLGELSLAEGSDAEAIKYFSAVIKSDPKYVLGYRRLALVYSNQNQAEKADETIRAAMAAVSDDSSLAIHLASLHEKNSEFDEAIEIYQSLLKKDEKSLIAKNNLANLLVDHRGDQASLEQARKIAVEFRNFEIPEFRDTYAWVSVKSGTNLEEAIVILEGIVRDYDQVDVYAYHLGEAYRRKGDSKNAITYLQKAITLSVPGSDISTRAKQALDQVL